MNQQHDTFSAMKETLAAENPEALLPDGFEGAAIGVARRCGQPTLAVYDARKAVEILVERDGMTEDEAVEFFDFNVVGSWNGAHSPIWLYRD